MQDQQIIRTHVFPMLRSVRDEAEAIKQHVAVAVLNARALYDLQTWYLHPDGTIEKKDCLLDGTHNIANLSLNAALQRLKEHDEDFLRVPKLTIPQGALIKDNKNCVPIRDGALFEAVKDFRLYSEVVPSVTPAMPLKARLGAALFGCSRFAALFG